MSTSVALMISVVLIGINGFFVAVELAFVASRRTKLETMAEEGARGATAAVIATSDVTRMLFAAQLGITVASLILGLIAEDAVAHLIESAIEGVVDVPSGLLHTIGRASDGPSVLVLQPEIASQDEEGPTQGYGEAGATEQNSGGLGQHNQA